MAENVKYFLKMLNLWPSAAGGIFDVHFMIVCYESVLRLKLTLSFGSAMSSTSAGGHALDSSVANYAKELKRTRPEAL